MIYILRLINIQEHSYLLAHKILLYFIYEELNKLYKTTSLYFS